MKVVMNKHCCKVTREKGDPVFSGTVNAAGESRLLHHLKKILNARGYDLIKKHMAKDGHLMSDMQQYLRTRKKTGKPSKDIYIYNSMWSINGADFYLRLNGSFTFSVVRDVFNAPKINNITSSN
jgi:hypothetical protein